MDILELLFVELLKWPGYTMINGDTVDILIRGFFLPTIFIIIFIYIIIGALSNVLSKKLKLLLGIGVYLFIITSGWYGGFAAITQMYFLYIIVVLGILYFIPGHLSGGHQYSGSLVAKPQSETREEKKVDKTIRHDRSFMNRLSAESRHIERKLKEEYRTIKKRINDIDREIKILERSQERIAEGRGDSRAAEGIARLVTEKQNLEKRRTEINQEYFDLTGHFIER